MVSDNTLANSTLYSSLFQALTTGVGAFSQASAQKAQGHYESQQAQVNADLSAYQAEEARRRGGKAAEAAGRRANKVLGAQRAGLAAQGIALDTGSAQALQDETYELSHEDQMTIQMNAAREAFGYKIQEGNSVAQSKWSEASTRNSAVNTMISGGMNAFGAGLEGYRKYRRAKYGGVPDARSLATDKEDY